LLHTKNVRGHSAEGAENCSGKGVTRNGVGIAGFLHCANLAAPTNEARLRNRAN
jgi:hypothetical protein